MVGKTISHYKILEKIGSSGMGIVYKAQDLKLDRFIHETKAASALDHNNICAIHEIDETGDGQLFISMAYYDGATLHEKIKEKRQKQEVET